MLIAETYNGRVSSQSPRLNGEVTYESIEHKLHDLREESSTKHRSSYDEEEHRMRESCFFTRRILSQISFPQGSDCKNSQEEENSYENYSSVEKGRES